MGMQKNCSVKNCSKTTVAKNLCDRHYRIFRKYGNTKDNKTLDLICLFCGKHFKISVPHSHTKYPKFCSTSCRNQNLKKNAPLCIYDGCTEKSVKLKGGYCSMHQTRVYMHGDPSKILKLSKYPEGTKCKIEGCKKPVLAKLMCNQHYTMFKIHGDPLAGAYRMPFKKALDHGDGTRTCTKCMERLPNSSFHKDKTATDGIRSTCKKCRIKHVQKWYLKDVGKRRKVAKDTRKKDGERLREYDLKRYERDREKRIALATEHSHLRKARKKKTKTERGISKLALKKKFGTKCYYCGKEMDFSTGKNRKFNRDMATIEHLIPLARGGEHTFKNTVLACRHCNISKNAKSEAEFEEYKKPNPK